VRQKVAHLVLIIVKVVQVLPLQKSLTPLFFGAETKNAIRKLLNAMTQGTGRNIHYWIFVGFWDWKLIPKIKKAEL
jgi:hypothetical protein